MQVGGRSGQVVGQDDRAADGRNMHNRVGERFFFLIGKGRIAGGEVHRIVLERFIACAGADGLVVDVGSGLLRVGGEPLRVDRRWERRAGPLDGAAGS